LREYFQQTVHVRLAQKRSELLELMSPALKAEVAWECNHGWLSRVWFLQGASQPFLVQLSLRLLAEVFAPSETLPAGKLYIIHRGVALYGGKVYGSGRVWGEDMILKSSNLRIAYSARAMIFVSVFSLSHDGFYEVARLFPDEESKVHRKAVRLATRRAFQMAAKAMKAGAVDGVSGVQDGDLRASSFVQPRAEIDREGSELRHKSFTQPRSPPHETHGSPLAVLRPHSLSPHEDPNGDHHERESPTRQVLNFFASQSFGPARTTPQLDSGRSTPYVSEQLDALRPMLESIMHNQKQTSKQLAELKSFCTNNMSRQSADLANVNHEIAGIKRLLAENAIQEVLHKLHA
jgi:hypothetical protein